MNMAVEPAFEPVYCCNSIPDCCAMVTLLDTMLWTLTQRISWVLSGITHAGCDWVCDPRVKLKDLKSKEMLTGPMFSVKTFAALLTMTTGGACQGKA